MKNPFSIERSYKVRHKILEVLHKDWEEHDHEANRVIGSIKIANDTHIPIAEIHRWQYLLLEKGEIVISDNDGQSMMSIQQNGINAYVDKRYIKEGWESKWNGIYNWARILIPLGALILSIINYISNQNINVKIQGLENRINHLKK